MEGKSVEDEARVVQEALDGSQRAYTLLLNSHRGAVYSLIRRMIGDEEEALDLSQQTFIKAFRSLESFNPSFSFRSWVLTIASRVAIDSLRKRRVETVSIEQTGEIAARTPTPEVVLQRKERRESIERAVGSLPPEYRVAILLRHKEGLSYEEMARVLDLPMGTVKSRVHRGREMLRRLLEGLNEPRGI